MHPQRNGNDYMSVIATADTSGLARMSAFWVLELQMTAGDTFQVWNEIGTGSGDLDSGYMTVTKLGY